MPSSPFGVGSLAPLPPALWFPFLSGSRIQTEQGERQAVHSPTKQGTHSPTHPRTHPPTHPNATSPAPPLSSPAPSSSKASSCGVPVGLSTQHLPRHAAPPACPSCPPPGEGEQQPVHYPCQAGPGHGHQCLPRRGLRKGACWPSSRRASCCLTHCYERAAGSAQLTISACCPLVLSSLLMPAVPKYFA